MEKIIFDRRSVRKYKSDKVSKELIQKVIDAAAQAPTAMGVDDLRFVVVENKEIMKKINEKIKEAFSKFFNLDDYFYGAPVAIFLFTEGASSGCEDLDSALALEVKKIIFFFHF
jgi:nitroreductase